MTLARRLLSAGGGAGSFAAPPGPVTLTSAPYGGWTQIPEARATWFNGVVYFGYVNGSNGNVEIRSYAAGVVSAATVLHSAMDTPADSHDAPAILVRPDGYIVVAYSAHLGGTLYTRVSSAAEDISSFEAEVTITGLTYTYPILVQRLAEVSDPVYLWYRTGTTGLRYHKSSDGGATWAAGNAGDPVYADGASYWKIVSDGQWRIDFVITQGNPSGATCPIGHFYADDTGWHQSDGTDIGDPGGSGFAFADITEVYDSSDGPAWATDAYLDASNRPRFVYSIDDGGTDSAFRFASADAGGAWTLSTILASVGFGIVDPSPVATIDVSREDRCYLVRHIAGHHELWRYSTADGGATWTGSAITSGSAVDNLYPVFVRNHPTGLVLWLYGDYVGAETDFDMGIKAVNA